MFGNMSAKMTVQVTLPLRSEPHVTVFTREVFHARVLLLVCPQLARCVRHTVTHRAAQDLDVGNRHAVYFDLMLLHAHNAAEDLLTDVTAEARVLIVSHADVSKIKI